MLKRTENIIGKIEQYLRFMRFGYTVQEQLSRLTILKDYYTVMNEKASKEQFTTKLLCAEQLKKGELTLPLKVSGVFLIEGKPKTKFYSAKELELAASNPINQKFPLCLDHKDTEVAKIIGMVDSISYDSETKSLKWEGHINDETVARNVVDGAIKYVSATVFSVTEYDDLYGMVGSDLTFKELSLVWEPAVSGAYIKVSN
jgi:hypothetical protein